MRNIEAGRIPAEIAENLQIFFPEHEDLTFEEFLWQQEMVYHSTTQASGKNKDICSDHGQRSDWSQLSGQGSGSSGVGSVESQLALDEAFARSLELTENSDDIHISEHSFTEAGRTVPGETPIMSMNQNMTQDNIDPDNMTYEQLQAVGESIGNESKGLSEELIAQLPTFKYKTGFFSRKPKMENGDCVICHATYKNGVRLTTLPCAHMYHTKCIAQWLNLNKNCPICKHEVEGD